MTRLPRLAFLLVAVPLALGACRKKPVVQPPQPPVQQTGGGQPPPVQPSNERPPVVENKTPSMDVATMRRLLLETVYFEYDSDEIRADAQSSLEKRLPLLNANPQVKLTIAGHCDERGSDEYNIALGRRRAEAVKRFLTDRGIAEARIETISFGRERPAMQGSSEEAYAKNRRDEFTIVNGDNLKSP